jgi:hypothetical protein
MLLLSVSNTLSSRAGGGAKVVVVSFHCNVVVAAAACVEAREAYPPGAVVEKETGLAGVVVGGAVAVAARVCECCGAADAGRVWRGVDDWAVAAAR